MHTARNQDAREGTVRGFMDQTMASVDYRLKPGPISPYAIPQTVTPKPPPHRPQATMTVDQYMKTKRGAKRRYVMWIIVIFPDFHSTKQGLPLVDSWLCGLD